MEDALAKHPSIDPVVDTGNPEIYVSTGYDPLNPATGVNAVVKTGDGTFFPMVVLATDNALDKSSPADRSELPDFDRATMNQLGSVGLSSLEAVVSAPTDLLAAALGQAPEYAESLVVEANATLQEDFRNGFMGYVGIGKAQSDALKGVFNRQQGEVTVGDRVKLANSSAAEIATALGGQVSEGFAQRLLKDVQGSLLPGAYSFSGLGMSDRMQATLREAGIDSNLAFRQQAAEDPAGMSKKMLGISTDTLDRYMEEATLDYARGEFMATPGKSLATLESMTPEVANKLAGEGVLSVKMLANSDTGLLAGRVDVAESEMSNIVTEAGAYSSGAFVTLFAGATGGTAEGWNTLASAGLGSAGALVRADSSDLISIGGIDATQALNVQRTMNKFLTGQRQSFRLF